MILPLSAADLAPCCCCCSAEVPRRLSSRCLLCLRRPRSLSAVALGRGRREERIAVLRRRKALVLPMGVWRRCLSTPSPGCGGCRRVPACFGRRAAGPCVVERSRVARGGMQSTVAAALGGADAREALYPKPLRLTPLKVRLRAPLSEPRPRVRCCGTRAAAFSPTTAVESSRKQSRMEAAPTNRSTLPLRPPRCCLARSRAYARGPHAPSVSWDVSSLPRLLA